MAKHASVDMGEQARHSFRVQTPGKLLAEWREKNETSCRAAAKLFGCAPSQICRFEDGTRWPTLDVAFAMEEEGVCPAHRWRKKKRL